MLGRKSKIEKLLLEIWGLPGVDGVELVPYGKPHDIWWRARVRFERDSGDLSIEWESSSGQTPEAALESALKSARFESALREGAEL